MKLQEREEVTIYPDVRKNIKLRQEIIKQINKEEEKMLHTYLKRKQEKPLYLMMIALGTLSTIIMVFLCVLK